eukprot:gene31703-38315_t
MSAPSRFHKPQDTLILRPYQQKVVEAALKANTLAVLPTGSGKTLVAIHVIRERLTLIRGESSDRRKIVVFLAPTKILVSQQKNYIEKNSDASVIDVTGETQTVGGHSKSFWHLTGWEEVLCMFEVVVMTPQVLCHILEKRLLNPTFIDTLVIDECHHANRNNPIASICRIVKESGSNTLILSMTASPVKCKKDPVVTQIKALEDVLNCKMLCTLEIIDEYRRTVPVASLGVFRYQTGSTGLLSWIANAGNELDNKDRSFSSKFDLTQSVRKFVFPRAIGSRQNPSGLLLHAYFRLKNALSIKNIYCCLNTMMENPASMRELERVSLPKTADYNNYLRGMPLPRDVAEYAGPAFQPIAHVLTPDYSSLHELSDILQVIGQVISIVEECGVISALYSFIVSLEDTLMLKTLSEASKRGIDGSRIPRTKDSLKRVKIKKSRASTYYDRDTQSNIDPEKLEYLAREVSTSNFHPIDLFHDQYVTCVSILDFFFAFGVALGPEICKRASTAFAFSCKKVKKPTLAYQIHIADDDYYTSSRGFYSIGRMNAVIWMLLKKLCDVDKNDVFNLTTEGCLLLIQEDIRNNSIFDSFELRIDVCCDAIRRICWFLLQAVSVKDLEKWTSVDHDFQCVSFEPLFLSSEQPRESLPDLIPNRLLELNDATQLEFVSAKVKALCLLWKRINKEEDFALQWIVGQHDMLTTMELKKEESEAKEAKEDKESLHESPMVSSALNSIPAASGADINNEASFIVFCQRRLTTRSLHFVLTLMLENRVNMPSNLLDFATDEENGLDETLENEIRMEVKGTLDELVKIIEAITEHDMRLRKHRGKIEVQDLVGNIIDQVEERVLGKYEAQMSRYTMKMRHYKANQLIKLPEFRP